MKLNSLLIVTFSLFIFGCANPSIVNIKRANIPKKSKVKMFVLRFEGNPNFVEETTDYFIANLESGTNLDIIRADNLRSEDEDILNGGNTIPKKNALAEANKHHADLVVIGKVTSHSTGAMLNGFCTVRIYNVVTGKLAANFHRPSGLLIAHSEHQCVMAAVKRVAEDTKNMLEK